MWTEVVVTFMDKYTQKLNSEFSYFNLTVFKDFIIKHYNFIYQLPSNKNMNKEIRIS